jgi:APA family basic amino acid/polyamine antiporter
MSKPTNSRSTESPSQTPSFFARNATGLVRSMNWVDLMFLNVVSFGGAWSIIYAVTYAPYYGGDPAVSLLLTAPGILALLGVYYIFNVSMPRSGGDYVYSSRVLHPAIGFAANFVGYTIFLWFWIGDAASLFSSQGLSQTLNVYGGLTGQGWASTLSTWVAQPWNNFTLGTIAIFGFAAIVIVSTRLYFWIQNIFMTLAVLSLAAIAILLVGSLANPSAFVSSFNKYAATSGLTPNPYANITASGASFAPASGVSPTNISAAILLVPLWFTVLFWVFVSNYLGGETKQVKTTAKRALFGGFAIIFVATIVIFEVLYYSLGPQSYNFVLGLDNIYYGYAPSTLGVIPNLSLIVAILANNPYVVLFLAVGIVSGFILVAPQCMILMSRILFSYSFDRLVPSSIADVNSRFATPVKAILVAAVGGEVMLVFLSNILSKGSTAGNSAQGTAFTALSLYTYAGLATIGLTFVFVSLSAIFFPWRRKDLYEQTSAVKRKIAGVPVITWLGIVALVYSLTTIVWYSYDYKFYTFGCPAGLAAGCDYNYFLIFLPIAFFVAIGYYFGVSAYRSRKGMPFGKVFAEIPPE